MSVGRLAQLVVSCIVLGAGIALLLDAGLGSDGYSTMVNGMHLSAEVPFWAVNLVVAVVFVLLAWQRGVRPGPGTVVQPVVVGFAVSLLLPFAPDPASNVWRGVELAVAFLVLCIGVAGYLSSQLGAGPTEAAALAWDPPVPFRWSYSILQCSGALVGWWLGADVGVGTLLVVVLVGPTVDRLSREVFHTVPSASGEPTRRPHRDAEDESLPCT
jgi:uncharacterized membrane protein YczE